MEVNKQTNELSRPHATVALYLPRLLSLSHQNLVSRFTLTPSYDCGMTLFFLCLEEICSRGKDIRWIIRPILSFYPLLALLPSRIIGPFFLLSLLSFSFLSSDVIVFTIKLKYPRTFSFLCESFFNEFSFICQVFPMKRSYQLSKFKLPY